MTEEEILNNQNGENGYDFVRIMKADNLYGINMQNEPLISPKDAIAAMKEHAASRAKEEAIEFGKFINNGWWWRGEDNFWRVSERNMDGLSDSQLYELFKSKP